MWKMEIGGAKELIFKYGYGLKVEGAPRHLFCFY